MSSLPRKLANLSRTARLFEAFVGDLASHLGPLAACRPAPVELCRVDDEASSALVRRVLRRLQRRCSR